MPIALLPQDTARIISSTLVLNDATSVVKELIDNALDARADNISIEISANTLDVVQVKDNGVGIGIEDRQLLCKRGCTSKIRSLEDLASLGGTFLGFRGEALASVAELSGPVSITTRVDGELTGTTLKFGPAGQLLNSSSASHPAGTTVRTQDFLKTIPVRKQTALKNTTKTLNNIRKLLFSYAFARPEVRLSFKVLKNKKDKANWNYAPSSKTSPLVEIASKIVGKDLASQCQEHIKNQSEEPTGEVNAGWSMRGLFISTDAAPHNAASSAQYFIIDGRPVNPDKGLVKELSKLYNRYLNAALKELSDTSPIPKPFLYLQIHCPADTYDVNVEPAKDEVLFYQPLHLRNLFESLLKDIYGEMAVEDKDKTTAKNVATQRKTAIDSFELLLARKPAEPTTSDAEKRTEATTINSPSPDVFAGTNVSEELMKSQSANTSLQLLKGTNKECEDLTIIDDGGEQVDLGPTLFNMSSIDEASEIEASGTGESRNADNNLIEEDQNDADDRLVTNPWSLAKMNIRITPKRIDIGPDISSTANTSNNLSTESMSKVLDSSSQPHRPHRTPLASKTQLVTPLQSPEESGSYQNPGPPTRRHGPHREDNNESDTSPTSESGPERSNETLLDVWTRRINNEDFVQPFKSGTEVCRNGNLTEQDRSSDPSRLVTQEEQFLGGDRNKRQLFTPQSLRPFKSPLKRLHPQKHTQISQKESFRQNGISLGSQQLETQPSQLTSSSTIPSQNTELDDIMEFEHRKRLTIANQKKLTGRNSWKQPRLSIPSSQTESPSRSPPLVIASSRREYARDTPEPSQTSIANYEDKFGKSHAIPSSLLNRSNPYHNRYLAALRRLTGPGDSDSSDPRPPQRFDQTTISNPTEPEATTTKIPESDPRGYLIAHHRSHQPTTSNGLTKTGLKIRRIKSSRLPFESIPSGSETFPLVTTLSVGTITDISRDFDALRRADECLQTNSGEIRVLDWEELLTSRSQAQELERWESTLNGFMFKIRTALGVEDSDIGDDEAEEEHIKIDLRKAIQAHLCIIDGG